MDCIKLLIHDQIHGLIEITYFITRGVYRGLVIGVMIAIPSGAGVALSVLGGNTGSLVGVAISASLLPPAVNAVSFIKSL